MTGQGEENRGFEEGGGGGGGRLYDRQDKGERRRRRGSSLWRGGCSSPSFAREACLAGRSFVCRKRRLQDACNQIRTLLAVTVTLSPTNWYYIVSTRVDIHHHYRDQTPAVGITNGTLLLSRSSEYGVVRLSFY